MVFIPRHLLFLLFYNHRFVNTSSPKPFDPEAVIFDLDGVITRTARVHSRAWEQLFNSYLEQRGKSLGKTYPPFRHDPDYLKYVDGKPRYEGVDSFLRSREIVIPWGFPGDPPGMETVCGLGNRKNELFRSILRKEGVETFSSTIALVRELLENGIATGVASSSKNCREILEAAGIEKLFQTRVDGEVSAELDLKGKPEPDIFLKACENLGKDPGISIVVEDAVSGVQAGKKGGFGLVIGIAREDNREELRRNGADVVVNDMSEIGGIKGLRDLFRRNFAG
ncbi:MAG TPA: beta-phosphoglucomutase family hydrolase [Bacteroidetes bacterium]|nr:beta-phosphoglucomutase family hydrolase [Bacteroidota bacterium]